MKDAVEHHNTHYDASAHLSLEAAVSGKVSSNRSLIGKGVEWLSGASLEGSSTIRGSLAGNASKQAFYNTSDGKAFNDAYHHMIATAKNSHLDTADTHNLSGAEQIAANFSSAESLLKQSSAEYSHGQQLQTAATHATENAKSIDDNLNQPYHDWVVDKYKAHGEQVMLQTDSASIATQHQWANEFLNSEVGQSAIGSQVHEALARTGGDVKRDYAVDANLIAQSKNMNARFQRDSHAVDNKASKTGLTPISSEQMAAAESLHAHHQVEPVVDEGVKIDNYVASQIKHTKIKLKEK